MTTDFFNKKQEKALAIVLFFLSDITLLAWLYFKATNYNEYFKRSSTMLDSINFQVQIYALFLQTLTFFFLLFIFAQMFIYFLAWRNLRSACLYLKFFSVFGFACTLYITLFHSFFAFLPMSFYLFTYYIFAQNSKITINQN